MRKKILVMGGAGLLGSHLIEELEKRNEVEIAFTYHNVKPDYDRENYVMDATNDKQVISTMNVADPDIIFNCIGCVKQHEQYDKHGYYLNAVFPRKLCSWMRSYMRSTSTAIHISTDCVFSGNVEDNLGKTSASEKDLPIPYGDAYGDHKLLGESYGNNFKTVRTSFIGEEKWSKKKYGLVEWFKEAARREEKIQGYRNCRYSGLPVRLLSEYLASMILDYKIDYMPNLIHVGSSEYIDKYDLLCLLRKKYQFNIEIEPVNKPMWRILDSTEFYERYCLEKRTWEEMVNEFI